MSKCEHVNPDTGECGPGIDKFDPVEFTEHYPQGDRDPVPYAWKLRANVDLQGSEFTPPIKWDMPAGSTEEFWICEDCHNICKQRLENQE